MFGATGPADPGMGAASFYDRMAGMREQIRQGVLLVALAATVFLTLLGTTHLWDDDETFFAQTAREMMERDDLVVPWFNQKLFAHKPPFMYWMMIGAYKVFGVTEFAARLPSALFGIMTVLLVWRLGRIVYNPEAGFWAGVVMATSLNYVVIARAATADAELTFFCTLAIYLFVRGTAAGLAWHEGQIRPAGWKTWAGVYAAMAVAVLVKGPIGIGLPTCVLALFLVWLRAPGAEAGKIALDKRPGLLRAFARIGPFLAPRHLAATIGSMRPLTGLAALMLVAGPWYLLVSVVTRGEFLEGFFGVHHFGRFSQPMDNHAGPPFFYPLALCVGFFPWIVFLGPTLLLLLRECRDEHSHRPGHVLCFAWLAIWMGVFSLASTKFAHYIVPAYPALALAIGKLIQHWAAQPAAWTRLARLTGWGTVAAVGVGILVIAPRLSMHLLGDRIDVTWSGILPIVVAFLGFVFSERRRVRLAMGVLAVGTALFFISLFGPGAIQADGFQNNDDLARVIRSHSAGLPRIAVFMYFRPGLVYYTNARVERIYRPEDVWDYFCRHSDGAFLITTEVQYNRLAPALAPDVKVLARGKWFLDHERMLVLLGRQSASGDAQETLAHRPREIE
jgi:4-amino-4-deoxy-L-arabinose transferase-like glycosyltransferase